MLAYGVGGRTMEGEGSSCKTLFSMSGDFMDPFVETQEELLNSYKGTLQTVKIALPINYKSVVQFVCDLAQMEYGTASDATHIKNYYVLTLLMAGIIDDLEDSVNEILRAANLPISVVIIKVGKSSTGDNDSAVLIEKTKSTFEQCERVFIDMLDLENYKRKEEGTDREVILESQLQFDMLRNLPYQIEKFFELQHFDLDVSKNIIESPDQTNYSSSDSSSQIDHEKLENLKQE